jgi:deoxyuridine 5'-triphosphate nucleotidohydrolase
VITLSNYNISIHYKKGSENNAVVIPTGLSCEIPTGTYLCIAPRSGLANSSMINIGAGVVNADYRGKIKILLFNLSNKPFKIKKGSKITQFILEQIINPPIVEVQDTSTTERGTQRFGLTNVPHAQEEKARAMTQAITVDASDQDTNHQRST